MSMYVYVCVRCEAISKYMGMILNGEHEYNRVLQLVLSFLLVLIIVCSALL